MWGRGKNHSPFVIAPDANSGCEIPFYMGAVSSGGTSPHRATSQQGPLCLCPSAPSWGLCLPLPQGVIITPAALPQAGFSGTHWAKPGSWQVQNDANSGVGKASYLVSSSPARRGRGANPSFLTLHLRRGLGCRGREGWFPQHAALPVSSL